MKKQQPNIYFQNQGLNLLCGLHSINNFLGSQRFTAEALNQICYVLGGRQKLINPHKHWFLSGDYDINVLMYALQQQKCQTKWHDKRNVLTSQQLKDMDGFLVNVVLTRGMTNFCGFFCCASGRHWLCIRKIDSNTYAILDSSKKVYQIKQEKQILKYIQDIQKQNAEVISIKYLYSDTQRKQKEKQNQSKQFIKLGGKSLKQ